MGAAVLGLAARALYECSAALAALVRSARSSEAEDRQVQACN